MWDEEADLRCAIVLAQDFRADVFFVTEDGFGVLLTPDYSDSDHSGRYPGPADLLAAFRSLRPASEEELRAALAARGSELLDVPWSPWPVN